MTISDSMKIAESSQNLEKTLCEKEKLQFLLFTHCLQRTCNAEKEKPGLVWERVNSFPSKPWVLPVCSISLLKTLWEKEKLLVTSNFSFFHSVFYPFDELSSIFIKFEIFVCKFFQFGRF